MLLKKENASKSPIEKFLSKPNLSTYIYLDLGENYFENVYNNLLNTIDFFSFSSIKDKFKNIPAIIVSAGPSLDKNIDLLKNAYDKALIFSAGSAINAIKNQKLHFLSSVDPSASSDKFKKNINFEIPFLYQNQMSNKNLSLIHGDKVLASESFLYPLERWIYEKLDILEPSFEYGWNISTFLTQIAFQMGCNPIIFVGLDLCFKKNKYAKNLLKEDKSYDLVKIKNRDGKNVYTQKDWILAKKWIEDFAITHNNLKFINATEGGVDIKNIQNQKFSNVLEGLERSSDLSGYVHSILQNENKIKLEKDKTLKVLNLIKESLDKCFSCTDTYLLDMERGVFDYDLIKFQNEIVYQKLLEPVWGVMKYLILKEVIDDAKHIFINKIIFFRSVIETHQKLIGKICKNMN